MRNHTSDALSRHPSGTRNPPRLHLQDDIATPTTTCPSINTPTIASISEPPLDEDEDHGLAIALCAAITITPINWEDLQIATAADPALQDLTYYIEEGTPTDKHSLPPAIRDYHQYLGDLSVVDGVICRGERLIIPTSLRPACLSALHAAHQGTSSMTARASTSIFWPGITGDIQATRNQCPTCNANAPSQPAMPSTTPINPEYPFQHICADYFHHEGSAYLVLVDRYSGWPIVTPACNGATGLATTLRDTFATFGIPDTLTSDGGPEFAAHSTREFLSAWGVHHRIATAYNPHANCRAEVAVKTIKRLITGNTGPGGTLLNSFHKALLQYRNCPSPDTGMSPARCLFGRDIRDLLPGIPPRFQPRTKLVKQRVKREQAISKRLTQGRARWDEHTHGLSPLRCGDSVLIQNQTGRHPTKWDKSGTIVEVLQYHKYSVRVDGSGRLTTRNRRYLRRYDPFPTEPVHPHCRELPTIPPVAADTPTPNRPLATSHPATPNTQSPTLVPPSQPVGTPSINTPPNPLPPQPTMPTTTLPVQPPQQSPRRPPLETPTTQRSYASVAKDPPRLTRPTITTPTTPEHLPPSTPPSTPAPGPRRSKRGPKPIDQYGH